MVLGARRVVGLDVPALRVYGAVHVVDADDLRFRSWEVERLFREIYHQPLPPEDAATLSQRTGGWAAGLAMFHLLTEGRPPAQRRRALADLSRGSRLVRSYLVREVLGDLPAELREFLRRTSALGVLTGALCDALLETTGSQTVLEELEQRRLFTTTPDDGRQFRYHQVLLDHLELELTEHLGAAASREWYGRAAELLLDAGEVPAAFRAYVRAEDWAAVEQLLHRRGAEVVAGPLGPLESMLPHGLVASDPWLLLARARRLAAEGALTEAVAAFRLAHSAAEDSQLAARCLEEARTAALWLPDADPVARTWAATIRAATQRNPRTLLPGGDRTCPAPRDGWPPGSWRCSPATWAWPRGCSARRRTTRTPTSASSRPRPAPAGWWACSPGRMSTTRPRTSRRSCSTPRSAAGRGCPGSGGRCWRWTPRAPPRPSSRATRGARRW